jgi:putative membrane protein
MSSDEVVPKSSTTGGVGSSTGGVGSSTRGTTSTTAGVGRPAGPPPEVAMRRLHPLTPFFRSWQMVGAAGAAGFGVFRDDLDKFMWFWRALHGDAEFSVVAKALAILGAVAAVSVLASWMSWRATGFALVDDGSPGGRLLFHRGLIVRQRSSVRLNRVQSVDVNQPLFPRLCGLAAVRLDMAAGAGASVNLAYLTRRDADALRTEILQHTSAAAPRDGTAHAAPKGHADAAGRTTDDLPALWTRDTEASEASARTETGDRLIARISTGQLVKANLLDGIWAWVLFVLWIVGVVGSGVVFGWQALAASLTGIVPVTVALAVQLRRQVASMLRDADFRLMRTPNGIRISSGLTSTINRTIDADRIQGVRIEEPYLWRRFGWARVAVDVAGADEKGTEGARLMPVAQHAAALRLVEDVTGAALDQLSLAPMGRGARLLDPLAYAYGGVALLDSGAVTVWGRWRRTTFYVPYARVQSVSAQQGWLQRRRGLVTVYLDPPEGGQRWQGQHRAVGSGAALVGTLAARARSHRQPIVALPTPDGSPPDGCTQVGAGQLGRPLLRNDQQMQRRS